jgi:hypothetical protein
MIINGYLDAKVLSTDPGVKLLSVGLEGTFMFTSYHNFLVHEIEIFGHYEDTCNSILHLSHSSYDLSFSQLLIHP